VEVIDSTDFRWLSGTPHCFTSDGFQFSVEKLVLYMSDSSPVCVHPDISIVSEHSFAGSFKLESVVFDSNSRLKLLSALAFLADCASFGLVRFGDIGAT
jgi:hypothetical protein